ncbi:MAG: hypothetical protein NTU44_13450 [Bacteroidetes bacterium]|nr:hypothetical protein [Bacteroidota bacterium]
MPSVIVTKFPSVITPARNPVYFELMSSPNLGTSHGRFSAKFFYVKPEIDGAAYTFNSKTLYLKFIFVVKPENEFQLPAWDGKMKLNEWLDQTVAGFQKCGALSSQYSVMVNYDDSCIYFDALTEGDEFTLWFTQANSTVQISTEFTDAAKGPGGTPKQNLRHGLQVWRGNGVQNYMVAEDLVTPVIENGMAVSRFDISELLLPAVQSNVNAFSGSQPGLHVWGYSCHY